MKKIILLLVIFLCLSFLFGACSLRKDGVIEVWARYDAFDGIGFDFDQYLLDLQKDKTIQIESHDPWCDHKFIQVYEVTYPDESVLNFYVYPDVETAKNAHQKEAEMIIPLRYMRPLFVSIRIDNIVVTPEPDTSGESPNLDLLSNKRLIDFAKNIGIESDQIVLNKINESFCIRRKDTDKSFESILETMEENGFTSHDPVVLEDENYQVHRFVASDKSVSYELVMYRGDRARFMLLYLIDELVLGSPYYEHSHVYYSIGDDFCMYFAGSSANTRDFWDEIRK